VSGRSSGTGVSGSVTSTCRRFGVTGRSTPASAATSPAHAPAALTTASAASVSPSATTPATGASGLDPSRRTSVTGVPVRISAPASRAASAKPRSPSEGSA